jgi:hypothetical protein
MRVLREVVQLGDSKKETGFESWSSSKEDSPKHDKLEESSRLEGV